MKFNNEVVYEHLLTPQVPFSLDYLEVVFSVCDIMCLIYAKFVEEVNPRAVGGSAVCSGPNQELA